MTQSPYPDLVTIRRNFQEPALASLRAEFESRDFAKDFEAIDEIKLEDQTLGIPPLANLIEEMAVYYAASGCREAMGLLHGGEDADGDSARVADGHGSQLYDRIPR